MFRRIISVAVCILFIANQAVFAVGLSPIPPKFPTNPNLLGLTVNPTDPANYFKFNLSTPKNTSLTKLQQESLDQTLKYFLTALTINESEFWVNLNPAEPNRMTGTNLAYTDMGKHMLLLDLKLKKDTSFALFPGLSQGATIYWERVFAKAKALQNLSAKRSTLSAKTLNIPTTFRVWIVPNKAEVYQDNNTCIIAKSTLKVMLESEYLKQSNNKDELQVYCESQLKELIIPILTKKVNHDPSYEPLRQIYNGIILAKWYKENHRTDNSTFSKIINQNNLNGIISKETVTKEQIFASYIDSIKQGEYHLQRTNYNESIKSNIRRSYVSGGMAMGPEVAAATTVLGTPQAQAAQDLVAPRAPAVVADPGLDALSKPSISSTGFGDEVRANRNIARGVLLIAFLQHKISEDRYKGLLAQIGQSNLPEIEDIDLAVDENIVVGFNDYKVIIIDTTEILSVENSKEQYASAGIKRKQIYVTRNEYNRWRKEGIRDAMLQHEIDEREYLLAWGKGRGLDAGQVSGFLKLTASTHKEQVSPRELIDTAHNYAILIAYLSAFEGAQGEQRKQQFLERLYREGPVDVRWRDWGRPGSIADIIQVLLNANMDAEFKATALEKISRLLAKAQERNTKDQKEALQLFQKAVIKKAGEKAYQAWVNARNTYEGQYVFDAKKATHIPELGEVAIAIHNKPGEGRDNFHLWSLDRELLWKMNDDSKREYYTTLGRVIDAAISKELDGFSVPVYKAHCLDKALSTLAQKVKDGIQATRSPAPAVVANPGTDTGSISSTGVGNEQVANNNIFRGILEIALRRGLIPEDQVTMRQQMFENSNGSLPMGADINLEVSAQDDNVQIVAGKKVIIIDTTDVLSVVEDDEQFASAGIQRDVVYVTRAEWDRWQAAGIVEEMVQHEADEAYWLRIQGEIRGKSTAEWSQYLKNSANIVEVRNLRDQAHAYAQTTVPAAIGFSMAKTKDARTKQVRALIKEINKEQSNLGTGRLPKIAIISDYHGDAAKFAVLLSDTFHQMCGFTGKINPNDSIEKQLNAQGLSLRTMQGAIYLGGDLLDRGKYGMKCFKMARELIEVGEGKVFYTSGNHDLWAFINLLGAHLPTYDGYHFYGDSEAENLWKQKRQENPAQVNDTMWWTARLAEYNASQAMLQETVLKGKAADIRKRFIEAYAKYKGSWNDAQLTAMENFAGHFASIDVPDPYIGLSGVGNTSTRWWKELVSQLTAAHRARSDAGADAEELMGWSEAIVFAGQLADLVEARLDRAMNNGRWWYRIFEAINNQAYASVEWWGKDWSSHKGWGQAVIGEINEDAATEDQMLTQANYISNPDLQALAAFYRSNFNLYLRNPFGNLITHGWFPVQPDGSIAIRYKGVTYSGRDIFEGLKIISNDVKNLKTPLPELWEALDLVNRWYADKTTEIKPPNVRRNIREIGIANIQSRLGVLRWMTGHNVLAKLRLHFLERDTAQPQFVHISTDKGMAEAFKGGGAYVLATANGIVLRGFASLESADLVDSPATVIEDKKGVKNTIDNTGMPRNEFLQTTKEALEKELVELGDEGDVNSAASLYVKLNHGRVNQVIGSLLPTELLLTDTTNKTEEGLRQARQSKLHEHVKRTVKTKQGVEVRAIGIKGLYERTGQLAHFGIGTVYGEPVIYYDIRLEDPRDPGPLDRVLEHEIYEIEQWLEFMETNGSVGKIGMPSQPHEVRAWIKNNVGRAMQLDRKYHAAAPDIEDLFPFNHSDHMTHLMENADLDWQGHLGDVTFAASSGGGSRESLQADPILMKVAVDRKLSSPEMQGATPAKRAEEILKIKGVRDIDVLKDALEVIAATKWADEKQGPRTWLVDLSKFDGETREILQLVLRVELAFGTSGLRGLVVDMTDLECYINIRGYVRWLKQVPESQGGLEEQIATGQTPTVYIAGDLRSSTSRIMAATYQAIIDEGCQVVNCGNVPSPTSMYYGVKNKGASLMITGSHIPDNRNGIKPNKLTGEVLKSDESGIKKAIAQARGEVSQAIKSGVETKFNANDMFTQAPTLPSVEARARQEYVERYTSVFNDKPLAGRRIVLYQHSAVGRDMAKEIFEALGAEVIVEERSDAFVPVDTEKIPPELQAKVDGWIAKHHPDAVVFTDGDSDRPGLFDNKGRFLWGDSLGAVVAAFLGVHAVAITISTNDQVDEFLNARGVKVVKTKIGSPYVVRAMAGLEAEGKRAVSSWEGNGGHLTQTDLTYNGKTLTPLPTRDAMLPLICALAAINRSGMNSADFVDQLPKRFKDADANKAIPTTVSKEIVKRYSPNNNKILEVRFNDNAQQLTVIYKVDPDIQTGNDTEKVFNYSDLAVKDILEKRKELETKYLTVDRGFTGGIKWVNFLDGIRIFFGNTDIIHLRPSGNAPECRVYAIASTEARAKQIKDLGINQILQQMKADIEASSSSTHSAGSGQAPAAPAAALSTPPAAPSVPMGSVSEAELVRQLSAQFAAWANITRGSPSTSLGINPKFDQAVTALTNLFIQNPSFLNPQVLNQAKTNVTPIVLEIIKTSIRRYNINLMRTALDPTKPYEGYDVVIVSSSTGDEAEYQQKLLERAFSGIRTTNNALNNKVMILSVVDPSEGGQVIGSAYTWLQAQRMAKKNGMSNLTDLAKQGKIKVAMFHNGGKGERASPMTQSLGNSRGAQKLVGTVKGSDSKELDLEVILGVVLQCLPFAKTSGNNMDVFWTSQIAFGTKPVDRLARTGAPISKFLVSVDKTNVVPQDLFDFGTALLTPDGQIVDFFGNKQFARRAGDKYEVVDEKFATLRDSQNGLGYDFGSFSIDLEMFFALYEFCEQHFAIVDSGKIVSPKDKRDIDPHFLQPLVTIINELNRMKQAGNLPDMNLVSEQFIPLFKSLLQEQASRKLYKDGATGDVTDEVIKFILQNHDQQFVRSLFNSGVGSIMLGSDTQWYRYRRPIDVANDKLEMLADIVGEKTAIGLSGNLETLPMDESSRLRAQEARLMRGISDDAVCQFTVNGKKVALSLEQVRDGVTIEGVYVKGSVIHNSVLLPGSRVVNSVVSNSEGRIVAENSYVETTTAFEVNSKNSFVHKVVRAGSVNANGEVVSDVYRPEINDPGFPVGQACMRAPIGFDPKGKDLNDINAKTEGGNHTFDQIRNMKCERDRNDAIETKLRQDTRRQMVIEKYKQNPTGLKLECPVQSYAWGQRGEGAFIPQLTGRQVGDQPWAELWIGAHSGAPAVATIEGEQVRLDQLTAKANDVVLGNEVAQRFGGLPYLMKVLTAGQMLSIQAHPNKKQAEAGFKAENEAGIPVNALNRNYKDDNHKPEIIMSLGDFYALNGFRPLDEVASVLAYLASLDVSFALDIAQSLDKLKSESSSYQEKQAALKEVYDFIMHMPQDKVDVILESLVTQLQGKQYTKEDHEYWVLEANKQYTITEKGKKHYDRGIFSIYLLNLVHLTKGQAMYLPAGELHAYLEGEGIEVMANSDNVLRGGLTPKYVDVRELLKTLTFNSGKPNILEAQRISDTESVYKTSAAEFELSRVELDNSRAAYQSPTEHSAEMLLVLDGEVQVYDSGRPVILRRGDVYMVPAVSGQYTLQAQTAKALVVKTSVPKKNENKQPRGLSHAWSIGDSSVGKASRSAQDAQTLLLEGIESIRTTLSDRLRSDLELYAAYHKMPSSEFYHDLIKAAIRNTDPEIAKATQIMAQQCLNIRFLVEKGVPNAEKLKVTLDKDEMLGAADVDRGPSYLDASDFPVERTGKEGSPGFYWRGVEGIKKLAGSIARGDANLPENQKLVLYTMLHGFLAVPKALYDATRSGRVSTIHDTAFLHDTLADSNQAHSTSSGQATSTGAGHFQADKLDVKYVTEGRGVQFNVKYDADGIIVEVKAQRVKAGDWAVALPGYVDYVVNLGGLRFNDISVALSEAEAKAFNPGEQFIPKTAPYAMLSGGTEVKLVESAPSITWVSAPSKEIFGGKTLLALYSTLTSDNLTEIVKRLGGSMADKDGLARAAEAAHPELAQAKLGAQAQEQPPVGGIDLSRVQITVLA